MIWQWFAAVCRVVTGFRNLRVGAIGARPAAFNTVRYSEKISGIARHLDRDLRSFRSARPDRPHEGQRRLTRRPSWPPSGNTWMPSGVPRAALLKMAKLGAVVDQWMAATEVTISAVQCWTSIEENLGVVPCTVMSMMSNELLLERLRGGYLRRARNARTATRLRHAVGSSRLEQ